MGSKWKLFKIIALFLAVSLILISFNSCQTYSITSNSLPDKTRVIEQDDQYLIASVVVTESPWNADAGGIGDASLSIQKAIDYVEESGGGVVYLPSGRYRLEQPLVIGRAVTLWGEWSPPGKYPEAGQTILLAFHGRNNPDGQALLTCRPHFESSIKNLAVYYPEQDPEQITPYSWTIKAGGSQIRNITLYNSYNGIYMEMLNGSVVSDIYVTALSKGIFAPNSLEFSWMYNIAVDPEIWSSAPAGLPNIPQSKSDIEKVTAYMEDHLIGLQLGRLDGISVHNVSIPRANKAVLIEKPSSQDPDRVFGIGGILSGINAEIIEHGWDGWYYGMRHANLDLLPEFRQIPDYTFAEYRKAATSLVLNVAGAPYDAVGNGEHDDSGAFLQALRDAGRAGGGTVYVPPGNYRISKPLLIPAGVELRGPLGAGRIRQGTETTVLEIVHGANPRNPEKAKAAITLKDNAGIRGLTVMYPDQGLIPEDLIAYPFTIRGDGAGCWIADAMLLNSWLGIDFAAKRCDDHLAMGIWGTVFDTGITVGGESHHGVLERLAWSYGPWKEAGRNQGLTSSDHMGKFGPYTYQNTIFYRFGDSTGEKTYGLVGFYPRVHMILDGDNGGVKDAEFRHTMFDVAAFANILADRVTDAAFYGFFGTGGIQGNSNWLESTERFEGSLSFHGTTLEQKFQNYQLHNKGGEFNFNYPASLTAGGDLDIQIVEVSGTMQDSDIANAFDTDWKSAWSISGKGTVLIDLGEIRSLSRWRIAFSGLPGEQLQVPDTVIVDVSVDGEQFYSVDVLYGNDDPWLDRPFDKVYEARYVKIICQKTSGGNKNVMIDKIDLW